MSRHRSRTLGVRTGPADALEQAAIDGRPADHFTRLWPTRPGQPGADAPLFLACMLPARLTALALLWVTATPARMVVALAAACALAVLLLI
jgi:hypothetical protein